MENKNLVIGASGHLGNNLVRELLKAGKSVRATARKSSPDEAFRGLDCEIVTADLLDKDSLESAMNGVDVMYLVAAVYKSWAVNIDKEIMDVNIRGTRNALEAAVEIGIKKIIYVSTSLAVDHDKQPINTEGWNSNYSDPYRASKTEAEKQAWDLAKQHGLSMISVLPSALVGPHCYGHITPSMGILQRILQNQLPINPDFYFNYVDIRDVARSIRVAAEKGRSGERYLLCQSESISSTEVFNLAHSLFPDVKIPKKIPYLMMLTAANIMSLKSKFTKQPPLMLPWQVRSFYRANKTYDTSKSKRDLGFDPKPQIEVLKEIMQALKN